MGFTILLIDDDDATNFINKMMLEESECVEHIDVLKNGQLAIDYLLNDSNPTPDIVFLDINMPVMDGWEFIEEYKTLDEAKKAKILMFMLTTSLNPNDISRAEKIVDINGFVRKPLTQKKLCEIVDQKKQELSN